MGLSNRLHDVSSNSIPILLVVMTAEWISYLRSLLCLLHSLGLIHLHPTSPTGNDPLAPAVGSDLASLVVIASSTRFFIYEATRSVGEEEEEEGAEEVKLLENWGLPTMLIRIVGSQQVGAIVSFR